MKTTELFVEQVLIGFLVLLVAALVFWADVYAFLIRRSDKSLELIATGGLLIGTAYLIGMVYDRVADTLLQHLESHGRLQFALARFKFKGKKVEGKKAKGGKVRTKEVKSEDIADGDLDAEVFDHYLATETDPFEDGKYRIMVLSNSEATAQMEYLRSRIRLTRALATIIPGLMIALLLAIDNGDAGDWWTIVALALPLVYLATLFLKAMKSEKIPFYRPPKTFQLHKVWGYIERAEMLPTQKKDAWRISHLIAVDEVWIALAVLTLLGTVLILKTQTYGLLFVLIVGLVLTIVVGWTWWRISMTFYAFVRDYAKYGSSKPPG